MGKKSRKQKGAASATTGASPAAETTATAADPAAALRAFKHAAKLIMDAEGDGRLTNSDARSSIRELTRRLQKMFLPEAPQHIEAIKIRDGIHEAVQSTATPLFGHAEWPRMLMLDSPHDIERMVYPYKPSLPPEHGGETPTLQGDTVRLFGLSSMRLNGRYGRVLGPGCSEGRAAVKLGPTIDEEAPPPWKMVDGKTVSVKFTNLKRSTPLERAMAELQQPQPCRFGEKACVQMGLQIYECHKKGETNCSDHVSMDPLCATPEYISAVADDKKRARLIEAHFNRKRFLLETVEQGTREERIDVGPCSRAACYWNGYVFFSDEKRPQARVELPGGGSFSLDSLMGLMGSSISPLY